MEGSSRHIKCPRVENHKTTGFLVEPGHLREANIIANADADLAVACLDYGQVITGAQVGAFFESNLTGDVDIEQVDFSMLGDQVSLGVKDGTRVVELVTVAFWDWASD